MAKSKASQASEKIAAPLAPESIAEPITSYSMKWEEGGFTIFKYVITDSGFSCTKVNEPEVLPVALAILEREFRKQFGI